LRADLERVLAGQPVHATPLLAEQDRWAPGPALAGDPGATSVLAPSRVRSGPRRRSRRRVPGWAVWLAAVALLAAPVAFFMVKSIGGLGAPTRTAPPLAGGILPLEPSTTATSPPATSAPAAPETTEQAPTTAPATTAAPSTTAVPTTQPALVDVPRVVGMRLARATAALTQAGFTVKSVGVPVEQRSRVGRVLQQVPGPGTGRPAGSQVLLLVGVARP
jgi:hypothetical protein